MKFTPIAPQDTFQWFACPYCNGDATIMHDGVKEIIKVVCLGSHMQKKQMCGTLMKILEVDS